MTRIKCVGCKKIKNKDSYSQKQLNDLAWKISSKGNVPVQTALIKCRLCTGQQVTELKCSICNEVKGLDGFSKAQRRNPDGAVRVSLGHVTKTDG